MPATTPGLPSRYAKPELLAYGGMAEVYRATDESLGRKVAVKVLSERYASDDEFHARFLREARTAASLSGEPNVIVIHDVGETRRNLPFIVMELVPGGTIADRLGHGRVPVEEALRWLEPLFDPNCTRNEALACWDRVYNTTFFSERGEEEARAASSWIKPVATSAALIGLESATSGAVLSSGGGRHA